MSRPNSTYEPGLVGRDGVVLADDGVEVLDFDRATAELDGLNGRYAVTILPGQDVRALLPYADRIARFDVAFPGFRDGRGYSTARILRESGFTGPVRAVGDVLRDQLFYMLRCGFDQFLIRDADPAEAVTSAAQRFTTFYQGAADGHQATWARRRAAAS